MKPFTNLVNRFGLPAFSWAYFVACCLGVVLCVHVVVSVSAADLGSPPYPVEVTHAQVEAILDEMVYAMRNLEDIRHETKRDDSETIAARIFLLNLGRLDRIPEPGEVAMVEEGSYENIMDMRDVLRRQFQLQRTFLSGPQGNGSAGL